MYLMEVSPFFLPIFLMADSDVPIVHQVQVAVTVRYFRILLFTLLKILSLLLMLGSVCHSLLIQTANMLSIYAQLPVCGDNY
jgi:hypothetical protein